MINILTNNFDVSVSADTYYNIYVGDLSLTWMSWFKDQAYQKVVIIADENTAHYCLPIFIEKTQLISHDLITVPAGELHKTLDTCRQIWSNLFHFQADRKILCINLGGGVIGDMAGFCAATYKRGVDFVQVPTTLLSQVDSSIGGKLGIDFQGIKNSIGVFENPRAVFIDTIFLKSLSPRELRSGFAEMLKHALIADAAEWDIYEKMEELNAIAWNDYIARTLCVKRNVVLQDPYEQNIRKSLNFGHTIGHAIESYFLETPEPLLHGEAIAIGMICESYISHHLAGLSVSELTRITSLLRKNYNFIELPPDKFDTFIATMRHDKKNENDQINFTLLSAIGAFETNHNASMDLIISSLEYYNQSISNS